jgi:Protein of unknown function (DUF2752)
VRYTKRDFKRIACDGLLAGLSCLYLAFAYLVVEYRLPYVPVCPFLLVTGRPCPLCGSTRIIGGYLHGAVSTGWGGLPSILWFTCVVAVTVVSFGRVVAREMK